MDIYDAIIIGAGPAGLTACLYAVRYRLNILLIEKMQIGGGLGYIEKLENYPGFPVGVSGFELSQAIKKQLNSYSYGFVEKEIDCIACDAKDKLWKVNDCKAKAIIIASGARPRRLGVKNEEKLTGRGVSYCAACDAPLFKDKGVAVIGGGNAALEEALYLTKFARSVSLIHRRPTLRADDVLQERARANDKIRFIMNSECIEIEGDRFVEGLKIRHKRGKIEDLSCAGVFVFAGTKPNTEFLKNLVHKDESGYIITDELMQTSAQGLFACGDCRHRPFRQVITACAEGAIAAFSVHEYLKRLK